jgi:phospholipase C
MLPDPSLPPGTDRIPQIHHIVLLMMENHSFDNYLGTLGRGDRLPNPALVNRRRDGTPVPSHHFATTGHRWRHRQTSPAMPSISGLLESDWDQPADMHVSHRERSLSVLL